MRGNSVPAHVVDWLEGLKSHWRCWRPVVRPRRRQSGDRSKSFLATPWNAPLDDLGGDRHWAWVRRPFLSADPGPQGYGGYFVVHGHTPNDLRPDPSPLGSNPPLSPQPRHRLGDDRGRRDGHFPRRRCSGGQGARALRSPERVRRGGRATPGASRRVAFAVMRRGASRDRLRLGQRQPRERHEGHKGRSAQFCGRFTPRRCGVGGAGDLSVMRTWIKDPLAILAEAAEGGIVSRTAASSNWWRGRRAARRSTQRSTPRAHVVLPGLVNAHHHFYQTLARAHPAAMKRELFDWLTALYPIWARIDAPRSAPRDADGAGRAAAVGLHYRRRPSQPVSAGLENAIDIEVEEARAIGCDDGDARRDEPLGEERRPAARGGRAGRRNDSRRQRARAEAVP